MAKMPSDAVAKPARQRKAKPAAPLSGTSDAPESAEKPTPAKAKRKAAPKAAKTTKAERCKWDRAYCAKVEALGAEGKSAPEIRRELGIPASTWRAWIKTHPEFAESVEEADDAAQAWWINLGRMGVRMGTNFNATAFVYITKNIFPARFRDRQDHQITGANDGPIVQELRAPDLINIPDARDALRSFQEFRASLAIAASPNGQTKH